MLDDLILNEKLFGLRNGILTRIAAKYFSLSWISGFYQHWPSKCIVICKCSCVSVKHSITYTMSGGGKVDKVSKLFQPEME
jgi:hypothetical protein